MTTFGNLARQKASRPEDSTETRICLREPEARAGLKTFVHFQSFLDVIQASKGRGGREKCG